MPGFHMPKPALAVQAQAAQRPGAPPSARPSRRGLRFALFSYFTSKEKIDINSQRGKSDVVRDFDKELSDGLYSGNGNERKTCALRPGEFSRRKKFQTICSLMLKSAINSNATD